jgi:hypothetical protein
MLARCRMTIAKNPKRLTTEEHQARAFISGATKPVRRNKIMWSAGWHTATRGRRAGKKGKKQRVLLANVLDARLKDNGEGKGNKL